jgi:hypothetical protein
MQDSVLLYDDGLHGDGSANDLLWGGLFVPATVGVYGVSVRTVDGGAGTTREPPIAAAFATAGPVSYAGFQFADPYGDTVLAPGADLSLRIGIRHMGDTGLITNVSARVSAVDSLVDVVSVPTVNWGTLFPGDMIYYSSDFVSLSLGAGRTGGSTASFVIDISSNGFPLWRDTISLVVTGVEGTEISLPTHYALGQNFPNPFNPSTTIMYELPMSSMVKLIVYDLLGREVSVLVSERRDAGIHEVQLDASGLSTGVYLYTLTAEGFIQTRKLLLVR